MKKYLHIIIISLLCLALAGCGARSASQPEETEEGKALRYRSYLSFVGSEPNTLDPQCTSEYYTVPWNVFDRLVEVQTTDGESSLVPSLATAWEISADGLTYIFHLRPDVVFSNGSAFTADDVKFSFERLLTNPKSQNQDIVTSIEGADDLSAGKATELKGVEVVDTLTLKVTLEHPYGPFLANLSTPGASILDQTTVQQMGDAFGTELEATVGTGAFMLEGWVHGIDITMKKNPFYWDEEPGCEGLRMLFLDDTVSMRNMFDKGVLDILDLELLGSEAEYIIHGDIYRTNLTRGPRVGIAYVALNESVEPLNDVRVRKALQLSLDRNLLVTAMISGRGNVENGIFPHGLLGHNRYLEEIPYDVEQAKKLLKEAGLSDGFAIDLYCTTAATESDRDQLSLIASMWEKIGVRTHIIAIDSDYFMDQRKEGKLPSYVSNWSADFNDPDNFIYTFFGTKDNSRSRSLCYDNDEVIARVQKARAIVNEDERLAEYQALEKQIVQEDAAWIPLYSKLHLFAVNDRVEGFQVSWNGWSSNNYRHISIQ